jgi:D-alanine transaminase
MRTIYKNGQYLPIEQATISIMDRGFLFADGVYDVSAVFNGKLVENGAHLARLKRSLDALNIPMPTTFEKIITAQHELIKQNNLTEGLVYIQVTRGVAERDFGYPQAEGEVLEPTLVMFTQGKKIADNITTKNGVKAITTPDIRWARRDIKSIALLAQVLAKNIAKAQGAFEAIMFDENSIVTEGSSSNIFIIKDNVLITKNLSNQILHGITRKSVLELAKKHKLKIAERDFSIDELYSADECFLTSATNFVVSIIEVDGKKIGQGVVGENTKKLLKLYIKNISE